ncbi:alpha/beta hydrolase [Inhella gelatinilytica]|uniref:Acyl-CoA:diacylglycerol acyltransferase n=1 Tax=Inhella gelatinilytica TaxID=2795030 RepID=A0A931IXZ7_9BURK|nr:alpha/beta hydrolase-fold protein [Inhella gelatinilytica]MBH9553661.1 hypothetical protein [Inhella gelatinilytica]
MRNPLISRRQAVGGVASLGVAWASTAWAAERPGRLERLPTWRPRELAARPVEVWLPPGYDPQRRRYAVIYAHDGQMMLDPGSTWNKRAWELDRMAAPLLTQGQLTDFIVVAPWNGGETRRAEYFPQGFLPHLPGPLRERYVREALLGRPLGDAYLRYLVEEVKPRVDAQYATRPERQHTHLLGSSMGGLISAYGLCEYPRVFGSAACLSTHWIGLWERNDEFPAAAVAYLTERAPDPATVRWWMDRGDQELDAQYDMAQARIDAFCGARGFKAPTFVSRVYAGTGHNEGAWRDRLPDVLSFLLTAQR